MGTLRPWLLVSFVVFTPAEIACGGGFSFSDNFIVLAPDQRIADQVLDQAERFRKDLAVRWLGEPLPAGVGRALVCVELSYKNSDGGFWPIDDARRKLHRLRVTMAPDKPLTHILAHETTHLILEIGFHGKLPIWADEGIAMLQDEEELDCARRQVIERYARSDNWPDLRKVLQAERIKGDLESYAIAASLTGFLLTRGDAANLFRFALDGTTGDWENAARKHYGLTMGELQSMWQAWAAQARPTTARQPLALRRESATSTEIH